MVKAYEILLPYKLRREIRWHSSRAPSFSRLVCFLLPLHIGRGASLLFRLLQPPLNQASSATSSGTAALEVSYSALSAGTLVSEEEKSSCMGASASSPSPGSPSFCCASSWRRPSIAASAILEQSKRTARIASSLAGMG